MEIKNLLEQNTIQFSFFDNHWPGELTSFTEIWIIGGDGTINYFLNHYKNISQPLALFKGGTGNDLHWKLYGNITIGEQFELLLKAKPVKVDVIQCNDRLYINTFGAGFDGEVLKSINAIRYLGGHLGYLVSALKNIFSFKEQSFNIIAGDEHISGKFLLVAVNNSSRTGGGFLISPRAEINDGKADIVLCEPLSVLKRLRYLAVIQKGNHMQLPFIKYIQEKEVLIETDKEIYAQLDGELIKGAEFRLKILPDYVSFLYNLRK